MNYTMIGLRLFHIFSAVVWVGATFTMVLFISETAAALGADAQKFMQYFTQRSRFQKYMAATSGLTVLSGIWMYYIVIGPVPNFSIGRDLALTVGALAGFAAMYIGIRMAGTVNKMRSVGEAIGKAGKPSQEQLGNMGQLQERLGQFGSLNAVLMVVALAGMTLSEYFAF
ncbi:MAG: hypothetical protein DWG76_06435 [Chloroflexi bacterium]|nr:hypothetical protein [Chloroflexota bacterium]MQC27066.1 hypothetical protein [Chloroflexota bacterium]